MEAPNWLRSFASAMNDLHFITEKVVSIRDVGKHQNSLLFRRKDAAANLVPYLVPEERDRIFPAGAILPDGKLVPKRRAPAAARGQEQGEPAPAAPQPGLQGIPVVVYQRSKWRFQTWLKYWPGRGEVVLHGGEYALIKGWNNTLRAGDVVQLWSFRRAGGQLCFVIFKVRSRSMQQ